MINYMDDTLLPVFLGLLSRLFIKNEKNVLILFFLL